MKKMMPTALIEWLAVNPNCIRADIITIYLPNGQKMLVTDAQFDITVGSGTPGWVNPNPPV